MTAGAAVWFTGNSASGPFLHSCIWMYLEDEVKKLYAPMPLVNALFKSALKKLMSGLDDLLSCCRLTRLWPILRFFPPAFLACFLIFSILASADFLYFTGTSFKLRQGCSWWGEFIRYFRAALWKSRSDDEMRFCLTFWWVYTTVPVCSPGKIWDNGRESIGRVDP